MRTVCSVEMLSLCFISWPSSFLFLNLVICLLSQNLIAAEDFEVPPYALCQSMETVSSDSVYQMNLDTTMSFLSSNSTNNIHFYNSTVGSGGNKVYGSFSCRADIPDAMCHECISSATSELNSNCHGKKEAIVWCYDKCLVRYSNESFLGIMDEFPMLPMWNRQHTLPITDVTSDPDSLMKVLIETLDAAAEVATSGQVDKKFSTREGKFGANLTSLTTIYTLTECSPDITLGDCKDCLQVTINNATVLCNNMAGCTLMCPSCNLRYDIMPFYGEAYFSNLSATGTKKMKRGELIGIIIALGLVAALSFGLLIFICKRRRENSHIDLNDMEDVENLKFDFGVIRSATNNFSDERKLGEGGFGEVFQGKLPSGQEIAVKRLSKNSSQGAKEFMTEVLLVAKLQHRNLVKLLGFCLDKQEKLLIYEFCPRLSLDQLLFDPMKCLTLTWQARFKIICGIAKGLLYLHEDSRLKIVHRDLKSSNVLLDDDMNPKISDFGTARLFGADETQGKTNNIAGTFGYMAPEYVIAGQYSVKSDVYSFGIMILELVSGQRNRFGMIEDQEESLLKRSWRLWNEELVMELVDKTMAHNYSRDEAAKCIHIGLLCIQEVAARRPKMASVVSALNGDAVVLLPPTAPHLFQTGPFGIEELGLEQSRTTFTGSKTISVLIAR